MPDLEWLDAPPAEGLERAGALLQSLGAVDANGRTTPEGAFLPHQRKRTS